MKNGPEVKRWIVMFLAMTAVTGWAGSGAGTTAVPFLSMGVGARSLAMGEAATASAEDATVLYWNPAALSRIKDRSATFMHETGLENSFLDYAAYASRSGDSGWGVGVQYFSSGRVEQTGFGALPAGSTNPHDVAVSGGYARTLVGFGVGLSVKYIQSNLGETASTYAVDGGVLSPEFWHDRLRAGVAVTNLGGRITYDRESASLPTTVRAGLDVYPGKGYTGAVDVVSPQSGDTYGALGAEYRAVLGTDLSLSLRGGYTSRSVGGDPQGFSAGVGFGWKKLTVDYAFLSKNDFSPSQVLSITYGF